MSVTPTTTRTARVRRIAALGAGAVLASAALSSVLSGAAEAAPAPHDPAPTASDAGNDKGRSLLTPGARAAGKAKHGADASYQQSLAAYWTAERMESAVPAEADPELRRAAVRHERSGRAQPDRNGPVRTVEAAGPTVTAAYNPNLPSTHPTAFTAGKVFYTKNGSNFVCSGTIIVSEGQDMVWTAGHCVHGGSGSGWHSNWTFVPAYDDDLANPRPYGTWAASYLNARTPWTQSSDFSQDFAVATMSTLNGQHINEVFGGLGFTVNRGKAVREFAFGYPGEAPYDGGNLRRCSGTTSPEWDYGFAWSQTVKIPCDMTRGSSGGGWLYAYDGEVGYLNGVNSRIDSITDPTVMASPYFDDDAWSLYSATRYN